eukprot:8848074-Pyramimonas_sp.AAC.1
MQLQTTRAEALSLGTQLAAMEAQNLELEGARARLLGEYESKCGELITKMQSVEKAYEESQKDFEEKESVMQVASSLRCLEPVSSLCTFRSIAANLARKNGVSRSLEVETARPDLAGGGGNEDEGGGPVAAADHAGACLDSVGGPEGGPEGV